MFGSHDPTPPDYSSAQVGDEIGGGIYAGTITYADAREFHLIGAKASGESDGQEWGNYARDYAGGGNTDWYIPATNEAAVVQAALGGFGVAHAEFAENSNSGDYTWTSNEATADAARIIRFSSGFVGQDWKYDTRIRGRPIRRVPVE